MSGIEYFLTALRSIAQNKVRALLTTLGVIIGVMSVILLIALIGVTRLVVGTAIGPTAALVYNGQSAWLLTWPATVAWVDARRGRWRRAAVLMGMLATIKPFLLVFAVVVVSFVVDLAYVVVDPRLHERRTA